jgi:antitoxin ParD1/3/4
MEKAMHVSLTDRLDEYVREKVASGLYNNASEVIREALRQQIAQEESTRLQNLRDTIAPAWEAADRGELSDYSLESTLARLKASS